MAGTSVFPWLFLPSPPPPTSTLSILDIIDQIWYWDTHSQSFPLLSSKFPWYYGRRTFLRLKNICCICWAESEICNVHCDNYTLWCVLMLLILLYFFRGHFLNKKIKKMLEANIPCSLFYIVSGPINLLTSMQDSQRAAKLPGGLNTSLGKIGKAQHFVLLKANLRPNHAC